MGNTVQIKEGVHWIGVKDPHIKVFDIVMITQWGTTYNSYLVQGEKTAIIDTSKEKFFPE
jgi:NADH oxidase (H2O-forming)